MIALARSREMQCFEPDLEVLIAVSPDELGFWASRDRNDPGTTGRLLNFFGVRAGFATLAEAVVVAELHGE